METLQNAPARHGQAATKHPLVSVVMPAYNAEKYIGEAIRSVQSQTYANWNLLVIDDCSTDHTADVVRAFVNTDDRIRLFQNTHNLGAAKTRNRGFELAKGEWVALLDSDDVWHSDKLERQLAAALNTFDAEGRLMKLEGLHEDLNGNLCYYVDYVKNYAGLVEVDGSFYYIIQSYTGIVNHFVWRKL